MSRRPTNFERRCRPPRMPLSEPKFGVDRLLMRESITCGPAGQSSVEFLPSPSPSPGVPPLQWHEILSAAGPLLPWALLAGVGLVVLLAFGGRRRSRPPSDLPKPAPGWATPKDLQQAGTFAPDEAAWAGRLYLADQIGVWQEGKKLKQKQASLFLPSGLSALVVGPTGSGKTSAVIKPAVVCWGPGSAVVTSTKPDVLRTWANRAQHGPVWLYDPTGSVGRPDLTVGWTPFWRCESWDHAVEAAAAMLAPLARDTTAKNAGHFAAMGRQLLSPLLHAAAAVRRADGRGPDQGPGRGVRPAAGSSGEGECRNRQGEVAGNCRPARRRTCRQHPRHGRDSAGVGRAGLDPGIHRPGQDAAARHRPAPDGVRPAPLPPRAPHHLSPAARARPGALARRLRPRTGPRRRLHSRGQRCAQRCGRQGRPDQAPRAAVGRRGAGG